MTILNLFSRNDFMFLFGLESMSCDGKKKGQAVIFDDLSSSVLEAGLEPARLLRPKDFKSFVSTDSTIRATLCFAVVSHNGCKDTINERDIQSLL